MSTVWAELKDHRITAERGVGVARLTMTLVCFASPNIQAQTAHDLRGDLQLDVHNSSPRYVTHCWTKRPFWFRGDNRAEGIIHAEVTPRQIEEIEELRNGNELRFILDFTMRPIGARDGQPAILDGHQSSLLVNSKYWTQALSAAGVAEDFLLVVPAPPATTDRKLTEAWKTWQKARDAMSGGRWDDAVLTARKAVDLLGHSSEPDAKPRDRTKDERVRSFGYAFYRLASAPGHGDDVTIEMTWDRDDAIVAVVTAGALIRKVVNLQRP